MGCSAQLILNSGKVILKVILRAARNVGNEPAHSDIIKQGPWID